MPYLSDEDYSFIYSRVPRLCVDLLVRNSAGAILLGLRDIEPFKDMWHMPGGRVMFKETLRQAAARIASKEIQSNISIINPCLGVLELTDEDFHAGPRHSVSVVMEVKIESDPQATEQNKDVKFFEKLPENIVSEHATFLRNSKIIS